MDARARTGTRGAPIGRRDLVKAMSVGCMTAGLAAPGIPRPAAAVSFLHLQGAATRQGEILVKNGEVVGPDGVSRADVRIVGEEISQIGTALEPGPSAKVVDAAGLLILPAGIDPHTHLNPPFVDDFTSGSRAALAGGITTIGTFAYPARDESPLEALDTFAASIASQAIADVILHPIAWPPTQEVIDLIPELAAAGHPSFKIFMLRSDFEQQLPMVIELLNRARDAGVVVLMHCEDAVLLRESAKKLESENKTSLRYYAQSRPIVAEVAATHRAVALCEFTRAPIYIVHLSSARALRACRNPDTHGLPLYVETRPIYLHFNQDRYEGPDGPLFVGQPPLRAVEDQVALWRGLASGAIDTLATDHAPWTREQKLDPSLTIERFRPGVNNLQTMLPMYFSEGVVQGRITIERFVATVATNPAKIFGLYPRKGVVREGSLADVVLWDPRLTQRIRSENALSNAGFSIFDGWEVTGWPVLTIRRGEIVYERGTVTGQPGSGRLLRRLAGGK